ncbi:MAG TPA: hypothetical protein VF342_02420 [Alphaproteobacteria bacterium]
MSKGSELDREFHRFEKRLPDGAARLIRRIRRPSSRWFRIPAAIILIAAGFVGFLPILGFWMIPLGLLLIAQDVPFLRRPMARMLAWIEAKWEAWRGPRRQPADANTASKRDRPR